MKNRIFNLILALLLPVFLISTPVLADSVEVGGYIRDHSDIITDEVEVQLESKVEELYKESGVPVYLITSDDADEVDVSDGAYAYADNNSIIIDETAYIVYFNTETWNFMTIYNDKYISLDEVNAIEAELINLWSDVRYDDGAGYFIDTVSSVIRGDANLGGAGSAEQEGAKPEIQPGFVMDTAGILTAEEVAALEAEIAEFAEEEDFGIYILTVDNYLDLYGNSDQWITANEFYLEYNLGLGEGKDGFLLMLSMDARDYADTVYGVRANSIFDDDAKDEVIDAVLEHLSYNDWYGGFDDFVDDVKYEVGPLGEITMVIIITLGSFGIAMIVAFSYKRQLKSVKKQAAAAHYVPESGVDMKIATDNFTHTTETRTKIVKSSGGGSGSGSGRSGGGFSGGSGKF